MSLEFCIHEIMKLRGNIVYVETKKIGRRKGY